MHEGPPPQDTASELPRGAIVGRYVVFGTVGAGGMGVVYAAHDPELDRKVALKLLGTGPGGSRPTTGARARLLREAQAMAKLSHPNVLTIYDAGTVGDQVFIAMELVDGVTLGRWLKDKPRTFHDVLGVFRDAGRGLAAAHAAGIVHRDFKPDNVLIDREGRVRVLDFGLARTSLRPEDQPDPHAEAPILPAKAAGSTAAATEAPAEPVDLGDTLPAPSGENLEWALTMTGAMLGTPLYMAPEQHLLQPADARTDQFSFCVALYEGLYGQAPFGGSALAELRAAVTAGKIQDPPKNARVPAWVRAILVRGLRAAPADRYPSMDALLADLGKDPSVTRRRWIAGAGSALALVAVAGLLRQRGRSRVATLGEPRRLTFAGNASSPRFSPDGQRIAYTAGEKLVVRDVATGTDTELQAGASFHHLGWLPDGSEVTFSKVAEKGHYAIPWRGGGAHLLVDTRPSAKVVRSPDGAEFVQATITAKHLTVVTPATGQERKIPLTWEFNWVEDVTWSPSGRWFLVTTVHQGRSAIWSVSADGPQQQRVVGESLRPMAPEWAHIDDVFYCLGSDGLYQVAFDPASGKAEGEPARISKDLEIASFSVAPDGSRIAYTRAQEHSNLWSVQLARGGSEITATRKPLTQGRFKTAAIAVSPDEKMVSFSQTEHVSNVFTMSLAGGSAKQLTALQVENEQVATTAWSPDGSEIVFAKHTSDGTVKLFRIAAGGGLPHPLRTGPISEDGELAWSPGQRILYHVPGNQNFMQLDPSTGDEQPLIREQKGWLFYPRYSPDAHRLALFWNRPPAYGLHVFSLDDQSVRLLRQGEIIPIGWSADGRSVYAMETDFGANPTKPQKLLIVPLEGGEPTTVALPFEPSAQRIENAVFVPSMDCIICVVRGVESDIWIADGVDPRAPSP